MSEFFIFLIKDLIFSLAREKRKRNYLSIFYLTAYYKLFVSVFLMLNGKENPPHGQTNCATKSTGKTGGIEKTDQFTTQKDVLFFNHCQQHESGSI
jgi:hypothetical protein